MLFSIRSIFFLLIGFQLLLIVLSVTHGIKFEGIPIFLITVTALNLGYHTLMIQNYYEYKHFKLSLFFFLIPVGLIIPYMYIYFSVKDNIVNEQNPDQVISSFMTVLTWLTNGMLSLSIIASFALMYEKIRS